MGCPFGRAELAASAVAKLESPLPPWVPQACGGIETPTQRKAKSLITSIMTPSGSTTLVTPIPKQRPPAPWLPPPIRILYD